jgi:hypothetical protein
MLMRYLVPMQARVRHLVQGDADDRLQGACPMAAAAQTRVSGVSRFCSWASGRLLMVLVSRCSDVGTSDRLDASSSTLIMHKSLPT